MTRFDTRLTQVFIAALAGLAFATHAAAAPPTPAITLNVSAANSSGVSVDLNPGHYAFFFVGKANGGLYDAYNPFGNGSGWSCDGSGANCAGGWSNMIGLDFGASSERFVLLNSRAPWYQNQFQTALGSLTAYQAGPLKFGPTTNGDDFVYTGYAQVPSASFDLTQESVVRFFVIDTYYADNYGGVSLLLAPGGTIVPEPASWVAMTAGLALCGAALRRRGTQRA